MGFSPRASPRVGVISEIRVVRPTGVSHIPELPTAFQRASTSVQAVDYLARVSHTQSAVPDRLEIALFDDLCRFLGKVGENEIGPSPANRQQALHQSGFPL